MKIHHFYKLSKLVVCYSEIENARSFAFFSVESLPNLSTESREP